MGACHSSINLPFAPNSFAESMRFPRTVTHGAGGFSIGVIMSECVIWTRAVSNGYGMMRVGSKTIRAHRAAWKERNGEIPIGICVLHRCDNKLCVNPDHLFLGTILDNVADRVKKNRSAKGVKNARSKLNDCAVSHIRQSTEPVATLAEKFNVSGSTIRHVKARRFWK